MTPKPPAATYFATPRAFRAWLAKHHKSETELLVDFHKRGSGTPSMTWPESVDEALCVGWIDGVRKRIDDERYTIRFTPRRRGSAWSAVNIARIAELEAAGRMRKAGRDAFARRLIEKSRIYSYEQRYEAVLEAEHDAALRGHATAWAFFRAQPRSYRHTITFWIVSAKRPETRLGRLKQLIDASAQARRLL